MSKPLAHEFVPPNPGASDLASEILARKIERWNNRAMAREQARRARLRAAMVFGAATLVSFIVLAGAVAVVEQGRQNWENTRIANVEP